METAKKKRQLDMLHGPIWNKIPQFALPVAATAILGQLFNAADVAVVGNFAGEMSTASVAAVGANSAIIGLIVNLFIGISLGANVTIAHAVGQGDHKAVHKAVHTAIVMSVLGGLIAAVLGEAIAAPLLSILNVPEDVFPLAVLYLRIYLAGLPVILLYNFEAAIFRSVGETKTPLIALTASGVLNVVLNLFFVAVLDMTVDGVALATVISNAVSAALLYRRLRKTTELIHVEPKQLHLDGESMKRILRIGLPAGLQSAVFSIANIIIQGAINSLGTVVMAASSAAFNIEIITYDILNAFSQACTTFVGQNYGAGQLERCKKTMFLCLGEGFASWPWCGADFVFRQTLLIFDSNLQVIEVGYIRQSADAFARFQPVLRGAKGYLRGLAFRCRRCRRCWAYAACG
ncbi:MAG: MATE family efflux transporter [Acutalibacteraceae bacterium]